MQLDFKHNNNNNDLNFHILEVVIDLFMTAHKHNAKDYLQNHQARKILMDSCGFSEDVANDYVIVAKKIVSRVRSTLHIDKTTEEYTFKA
ncbi:MAG: hypothetical protein ACRBHB_06930 [Arenicella sp.]